MQEITEQNSAELAIKAMVNKYSDVLFSWALYKTSNREIAEDLVQDTFLAAFKSFSNFNNQATEKTWLFSILKNKIGDYFRKKYRSPNHSDIQFIDTVFDTNGSWKQNERPSEWNDQEESLIDDIHFRAVLDICLKNLPENWLSAIQMKYLEEKNSEIICQELEISATNYWQIIHRAKLKLRKCLEMNWFKK